MLILVENLHLAGRKSSPETIKKRCKTPCNVAVAALSSNACEPRKPCKPRQFLLAVKVRLSDSVAGGGGGGGGVVIQVVFDCVLRYHFSR